MARALGHEFRDARLLEQALTHRSLGVHNNERLEFLGDALLNLFTAEALYRLRPDEDEGSLSRLRASLVREESLAAVARQLQLGDVLRLGESELKSGGFRRDSILADTFEALIGAVYLDAGFEAAQAVALRMFEQALNHLPDPQSLKDPKTRLQEYLQGLSRPLPRYEILSESGPPHRREFQVRCVLNDEARQTEATAGSRRNAEQQAAEKMLTMLRQGTVHA